MVHSGSLGRADLHAGESGERVGGHCPPSRGSVWVDRQGRFPHADVDLHHVLCVRSTVGLAHEPTWYEIHLFVGTYFRGGKGGKKC